MLEAKNRLSAVEFPSETRMHVALRVREIQRSVDFYQALFGQPPVKVKPGYAKFEVTEPNVNFSLNEDPTTPATGTVSHFGIQVKSTAAVEAQRQRLEQLRIPSRTEESVTCCYAVQDKIWVADPDGNEWEFFVVVEKDASGPATVATGPNACCAPGADAPQALTQLKLR